jgi:membrane protein implicated in regulation of membrane protease activity
MVVFLFLLVLAALAGVLGAVLKTIALVVLALFLGVMIMAWWVWRSFRRAVRTASDATTGSTTITIGPARRTSDGTGPPATPGPRDDRY